MFIKILPISFLAILQGKIGSSLYIELCKLKIEKEEKEWPWASTKDVNVVIRVLFFQLCMLYICLRLIFPLFEVSFRFVFFSSLTGFSLFPFIHLIYKWVIFNCRDLQVAALMQMHNLFACLLQMVVNC